MACPLPQRAIASVSLGYFTSTLVVMGWMRGWWGTTGERTRHSKHKGSLRRGGGGGGGTSIAMISCATFSMGGGVGGGGTQRARRTPWHIDGLPQRDFHFPQLL